jgi:hypothetical protein
MKTPEEMAEEYADSCVSDTYYTPLKAGFVAGYKSKAAFLAGYKAAQDQFRSTTGEAGDKLTPTGWISVKDRLPQMYEEVIVAVPFVFEDENGPTNQKGCGVRTSRLVEDPQGAKWNIHIEEKWVDHITHWMPLPAPPKEDK